MKIRREGLLCGIAISAVISALSYAAVIDKIAIVVNNEIITQGEIDRIIAPAYQQYKNTFSGEQLIQKLDEARQGVIAQLIEEKLLLSEARKQNIEVEEKEVNAKVAEARKRFPSNEVFEEALASQRITLKELKVKFREQLMVRKLVDVKVGSRVFVTPNDISDYYDKHKDEFILPEEIKLSNILIKPKDGMTEEKALNLVSEVSKRLKAGESFNELAKAYSDGPGAADGGAMGYVKRGDLMPEIEKIIFDMKVGEISGMVRTKIGYHFFRLDERKDPQVMSIADARKSIEDLLWMNRMKEKSREWIEELRKHAYIAFK